jgi:hypothetical protein
VKGRQILLTLLLGLIVFIKTMVLAFELVAEKARTQINAFGHPLIAGLNPNEFEILRLTLLKTGPLHLRKWCRPDLCSSINFLSYCNGDSIDSVRGILWKTQVAFGLDTNSLNRLYYY